MHGIDCDVKIRADSCGDIIPDFEVSQIVRGKVLAVRIESEP